MKAKSVFLALSAITIMSFGGSSTTQAKGTETEPKKEVVKEKVVTVKSGDTLEAIASANDTTYVHLFNGNESIEHPNMIDVGDKITIPKKGADLPDRYSKIMQAPVAAPVASNPAPVAAPVVAPAPAPTTTREYTSAPVNANSYYVGNGMWCTDYVNSKRPDVPIYGNAGYNWVSAAQADGKSTGSAPKAGAVAVTDGHVAYVEKVNSDGSYVVSEMGWNYTPGQYNQRTVQPGSFGSFIY